jgi:alkanesulfonate monooxygenase SsuD/methylene tetrahydromethanopterin reductase-like flavin-dependent oxidoreductase (luciferase family)
VTSRHLHLAVALDGAGAHPAAWRHPDAAAEVTSAGRLVDQARLAERGLLDFVTLDDAMALQPGGEDRLRARLDAVLALARVAPDTTAVGLVPTATVTHTEPFHLSKNVATLDWVSNGRAGWMPAVSRTAEEADHFGRKGVEDEAGLYEEAGEAVDVVRRLWDSWEDDAIVRDVPSGRYIDRDKVHYVDYVGSRFSVRGPSITPRSPQGQPLVVADAAGSHALAFAARWAHVLLVEAPDAHEAAGAVAAARAAAAENDRSEDVRVLVHLEVLLGKTDAAAVDAAMALGRMVPWGPTPGRGRFLGTAADLATELVAWADASGADGFLLHPAVLPLDLRSIVDGTVPALQAAGRFRTRYAGTTLRDRFGLLRPVSRYATGEVAR